MRTKFATPILYAIDKFKNYDNFSIYTYPLIIPFVYFFETFSHLHFLVIFLVRCCVILVGNGMFSRKKIYQIWLLLSTM